MVSLTIRITPDLLTALATASKAQGVTRTALVTAALERHLDLPLEPLEARLQTLEARLQVLETALSPPAPTPQAQAPAPQAQAQAPTPTALAPAPAPAPAPTPQAPTGLTINQACMASGLTERDYQRNVASYCQRRYGASPSQLLQGQGWVQVNKLWYPPQAPTPQAPA